MYLPGYSTGCRGTGSGIYLDTILGVERLVVETGWFTDRQESGKDLFTSFMAGDQTIKNAQISLILY